jgi:CelD/BcsL family acetyltransferase involved in cellulose biosynthesis
MEFNDFICLEEYRVDAVNACLQALQMSDEECDEIVLSMVTSSRASDIQSVISEAEIQVTSASYARDLSSLRKHGSSYLASLTSNTRYQIRRSERLYNSLHGEVKFTLAEDVHQALEYFHEAGTFHILRWDDSGFNNPQFVAFHEGLIRDTFEKRSVDLMKITAGDETIAILYFHIVDNDVYFYLQGVNYESNKKLKPGLLAHSIATQYYLDKGMRKYDYMGGYSQYKCQLSSPSEDMVTLCIQRPSIAFSLEKSGRIIKSLITK